MCAFVDHRFANFLLLLLFSLGVTKCRGNQETFGELDRMLEDAKSLRRSRDSKSVPAIWQEYEFGTGAGNREEVVVTNITVREYTNLPGNEINWQFLEVDGSGYLAGAEKSVLSLYKLNSDNVLSDQPIKRTLDGIVLTFKLIVVSNPRSQNLNPVKSDIVAVLCLESNTGSSLEWFRVLDDTFEYFWSWPVQRHAKTLEFIQHRNENKLLLLDNNEVQFGKQHSVIDVYGFRIDFPNNDYSFWFWQKVLVPRAFDIQVCQIYETVSLALQGINNVYVYEYRTNIENLFQELPSIKSHDLKNFVCFESGYVQYLAISGPEASLFNVVENEFRHNAESESNFEIGEVAWIKDVRINTYREESLLLYQLKNSTVIALAWHGLGFKKIQLPSDVLDQFDLSKMTAIPKFGFVVGNRFVKFETTLRDVGRPIQDKMEELLGTKALLEAVLGSQEKILDNIEQRIEKSYLNNPVITGFWNLTSASTTNAFINDNVTYHYVTIGSTNLTRNDLRIDTGVYAKTLNTLEQRLDEITSNLRGSIDSNTTNVYLESDVDISGNLNIIGTLNVKNLIANVINDANVLIGTDTRKENVIDGKKIFPFIEAKNLTILSFNGIPVQDIYFRDTRFDLSNVHLSEIRRAEIDGHLSFATLNGYNWETVMRNVVWKDKPAVIPGSVTVEGDITADDAEINNMNGFHYPDDFILSDSIISDNVTGTKIFNALSISNVLGINSINGIATEDFVILNDNNTLTEEIVFENLSIEGHLQVDGKIVGIDARPNLILNETHEISSDIIFSNLLILGNITVENSIAGKNWSSFHDILLKTDENVEITGTKTFLNDVEIGYKMEIKTGIVNGHDMNEFMTLDTEQELPSNNILNDCRDVQSAPQHLERISADVTFGNVTFGAVKKLEKFIDENKNEETGCLDKIIIFKSPITVSEVSFDTLRGNVSAEVFYRKLNETLRTVRFDTLTVNTLLAEELIPKTVNKITFANLAERFARPKIINDYKTENLEIETLRAKFINGMSLDELNLLKNRFETLYDEIINGNKSIKSLLVTGMIDTPAINKTILKDQYKEDRMGTVIFEKDISIENLRILGSTNGVNFSEFVSDTILKTDRSIVISGHKTFDVINCNYLEAKALNGHPVENMLDPFKEQVLTGPVIVNGSVTVLKNFSGNGKIGDLYVRDLTEAIKLVGKNKYELRGNFHFTEEVSIANLYTNGTVQGTEFDSFMETVILKNENNLTITGTKIFENSVTFNGGITIGDTLNGLDLKKFYEKAVFVDKPFSVQSKIRFLENVIIEKDLIVNSSFDAKTMMGVDISELQDTAIYLNRPEYIPDPMIFSNVNFQSNIKVEKINNLDMDLLIPLHTDQTIDVEFLKCRNVTAKQINIVGRINGHNLSAIKQNTFMLIGDQNITGHMHFHGNVYARQNFDAPLINGIDPKQMVLVNTKDTLIGNFVFKKPIVLNRSLRVFGKLNEIDFTRWEGVSIKTRSQLSQIVYGNWTVHGNVYFKNGILENDIFNGTNVTAISSTLAKKKLEMDAVMTEMTMNLEHACEDLNVLRESAENQIYKFSTFDYLQILEFDREIVGAHYFELDDLDYLLISYDTCHMHVFVFEGTKFELIANVPDFGAIDRWTTFKVDKILYFLTIGKDSCGKSPGNLWKLENDKFTHLLNLGNVTDSRKINNDAFLTLVNNNKVVKQSIRGGEENMKLPEIFSHADHENFKFISNSDRILLTSRQSIYEYNTDVRNNTRFENYFGSSEILSFKVGIFEEERFLYYDEEVSKDYIFICSNDISQKKILQTIKAHRPQSLTIINFEGLVETLLVFVENGKSLRIYEYQGIHGFVYKTAIRMNVDKLFSFNLRRYPNFAKQHCLAVIQGNQLTILEAKMYGEKLEMEKLSCSIR